MKTHVILTDVAPPIDRQENWGARALNNPVGPRDEMLQADFELLGSKLQAGPPGQGVYPLRMEPHWLDVYYSIDGFTVYDCRRDPSIGKFVYVKKGEALPTYIHEDCGKGPASTKVSKQHYLMLMGPGGVLLCAAIRSGSKLWSGKGDGEEPPRRRLRTADGSGGSSSRPFLWWWELIVMYVDEDLQVEPAADTCKRLATRIWQVQSY